ncbi:MAG: Hsp20/alpha crystallin family protein [Gammaproteobacteria bacterium]|nr:Hsp20/alpha crystallin family protein [Gammaproteobacteria bacterium]
MNELVSRRNRLGDDFDDLFEGFFRPMRQVAQDTGMVPAVDISEEEGRYIVKADLPGVRKDDIDVSINDDVLTINAESKMEQEDKDRSGRVIRQERRVGKYVRSMRLGTHVDQNKVQAKYEDGVLKLSLPKVEEAKPKKIAIEVH